jgi:hypothetical protein
MNRLLALAAAAALTAACTSPCQELGDRICECDPAGVGKDACLRQVDNAVTEADPTKSQEDACTGFLGDCHTASGAETGAAFCEWLSSTEGKSACGLAYSTAP